MRHVVQRTSGNVLHVIDLSLFPSRHSVGGAYAGEKKRYKSFDTRLQREFQKFNEQVTCLFTITRGSYPMVSRRSEHDSPFRRYHSVIMNGAQDLSRLFLNSVRCFARELFMRFQTSLRFDWSQRPRVSLLTMIIYNYSVFRGYGAKKELWTPRQYCQTL